MKTLPLSHLSSTPELVADVMSGSARVDFGFQVRAESDHWTRKLEEERQVDRPRDEVAAALLRDADGIELPEAARNNIEALRSPDTLAVITGQQVGLAGGPLLTLYKALTTIEVARRMEEKTGIRTVPLFWMATSDHNLPEAAQIHWINKDNSLASYRAPGQDNRVPVGQLKLGQMATDMVQAMERDLPDTDFRDDILPHLRECYTPEATFAEAFRQLGYRLLGSRGLVMFDPESPAVKTATSPFWVRAVDDVDHRLSLMADRSRQLRDAGYNVQAPVESGRPAIFYHEDGLRRKVVLEGKARRARSDMIFSREELSRIARTTPERLSAGVTLRPHLQGFLFPTAAYIAGPHEMAYWSQLAGSFEGFGLTSPAVIPRASMTIIESKIQKKLDKLDLKPEDIFRDLQELTEQLLQSSRDDRAESLFSDIEETVRKTEEAVLILANEPEFAGLSTAVDNAYRKIGYHLDKLHGQFTDKIRRQNSDLVAHLDKLAIHLRPAGRPQERVLTPFYYFIRYGLELRDKLATLAGDTIGDHTFVTAEELLS
ncbi:bacillithiol biosynthesis cysteine-adding enzyme BshC [bacterium]|nr:bacillithiol biosynthesis cysteine-adding enzyme BshC [bacterium]